MAFGKAPVDHGADAVYIGPERFGARTATGNNVADIANRFQVVFNCREYEMQIRTK